MTPRQPKKTETVEIRLPHETKLAFMARCKADGRTASDAIRRFIDSELQRQEPSAAGRKARTGRRGAIAAALGVAIVGALAVPSLAQSLARGSTPDQVFSALDRNGDGVLTREEFRSR